MGNEFIRKIIQICSNSNTAVLDGETLYALCDDGTVWGLGYSSEDGHAWFRQPEIPQDENNNEE